MYVYTPIAVLAVAGLPRDPPDRPTGSSRVARRRSTCLPKGSRSPALDAGNFFAAPAAGLLDACRPASPGRLGGRSARLAVDRRQRLAARRSRSGRDVDLRPCGPAPRSHPRDRSNTRRRSRALRHRPGAGAELRLQAGAVRHGRRPGRHRAVARPRQRSRHLARRPGRRRPRHCGHAGRDFELGPVGWHRGAAVLEQGARFHRCAPLERNRRAGPSRLLGCGDRAWSRRSRSLGGPASVAGRPPRRSARSVPRTARRQLVDSPLRAVPDRKLSASAVDESGASTGRSRLEGYAGGHDPRSRRPRAGRWQSRSRCARSRVRPRRCAGG